MASVEIVPDDTIDNHQEKRVKVDDTEAKSINKVCKNLEKEQSTPDLPENIAKLPRLKKSDIGPIKEFPGYSLCNINHIDCIHHKIKTNDITYITRFYDLSNIKFEDLPYVSVLAKILGKLDTTEHCAADLDSIILEKFGSFSFSVVHHDKINNINNVTSNFCIKTSSLADNLDYQAQIIDEILYKTNLDSKEKIKAILIQNKTTLEQMFIVSGHTVSMQRSLSYVLPCYIASEQTSSIDYYNFLVELLTNFDNKYEKLKTKLIYLANNIFNKSPLVSFVGPDKDLKKYIKIIKTDNTASKASTISTADKTNVTVTQAASDKSGITETTDATDTKAASNTSSTIFTASKSADNKTTSQIKNTMSIPKPIDKCEFFTIPADVSYASCGYDLRVFKDGKYLYNGAFMVASNMISLEYLWNEIRVKGGAYGAGMGIIPKGSLRYYSYRDPNFLNSYKQYKLSGNWLKDTHPNQKIIDGYIISSVAKIDAPKYAKSIMSLQENNYFSEISQDYRKQYRDQAMHSNQKSIEGAADIINKMASCAKKCTLGSASDAKKSGMNVKNLM